MPSPTASSRPIARRMHEPGLDSHGDPIPAADGTILRRRLKPLNEWPLRKPPSSHAFIRAARPCCGDIVSLGITLNTRVEVMQRSVADGPLTLSVNGRQNSIEHQAAGCILVEAWES